MTASILRFTTQRGLSQKTAIATPEHVTRSLISFELAIEPCGCMVVNGRSVCASPIDKYNFLHSGQTNYRDSNSRCSQHTSVNNKTGQVQGHIDEFKPNTFCCEHVLLYVVSDVMCDITGSYLMPTGNRLFSGGNPLRTSTSKRISGHSVHLRLSLSR